ncbi:ISAs1 family transposase [Oceanisphaera sp. DM8]|uniref:ISAs1 family transposase n=1 Tax=Oceanisphaera pacifica TaxID=2818389 RepID=A0ABS3NGN1_9GAMM|nr:ISAs1 family transposase [Oceanisphaera pacifica]
MNTYRESLQGKGFRNLALEKGQPATGITLRYYISSAQLTSKELLEASRAHWSIESQLHWRLDVGMREDECRIRREQAGENFTAIRHITLNLLSADTSFKAGIKQKQKRAGRNNEYLSRVLAGQGLS